MFVKTPNAEFYQEITDKNADSVKSGKYKDPFWAYTNLNELANRWDKRLQYRLSVWTKKDGVWNSEKSPIGSFVLPIPPESLTISVPYAITTTTTLGGIVEEHNGAPLRTITLSGTTGVMPVRGTVMGASGTTGSTTPSIIGGTLGGANALASSIAQFGATNKASILVDTEAQEVEIGSGYMQFKLLQRFLEAYITLKKSKEGRNHILAFEMYKDGETYFVSPVSFELRRSAASPLEYQYSLVMRAWKRGANLGWPKDAFSYAPVVRDLNAMGKLLGAIEGARSILMAAEQLLNGIQSDINQVFNVIREVAVFVKDVIGVGLAVVDLPANIISDLKAPIAAIASIPGELRKFGGAGDRLARAGEGLNNAVQDMEQAFENLGISSGQSQTGGGLQPNADTGKTQQGLNSTGPADGGGSPQDGNPIHKAMANPNAHFDFLKTISVGSLDLPPHTQKKIDEEKRRIRRMKREDFEERRDIVAKALIDFENSVGLGNATYTRIYSQGAAANAVKPQVREASEGDHEVIFAMNTILTEMNRLVVSSDINRDEVSSIDYIAGLATSSGIAFQAPRSKFLVPLPYAHTLEQISLMYLGTPDRWHEIAALNGLQAPYVDETGFTLPLLTNGSGNTVTVSDSSRLFVNQPVWLSSTTVSRVKRRITKIETLSPGFVAVTVTGDGDMDQFTVGAGAALQAFLPNTVNSQQSIFIPSDEEVNEEDYRLKSVPGVDYSDPLLRVGGIDLLLTQSGDLVITPDGDTRLAVGLTNIVQKVRLVIDTVRGSLLHHPEYGFPSILGQSVADLSAKDLLVAVKDLFRDDPTFTGVESAAILIDGPVCKITLSVGIAGTQQVIPISVEIPR